METFDLHASSNAFVSLFAHSVFFGSVFMSLQHPDPVSTAKPLDLPYCQVPEFLTRQKRNNRTGCETKGRGKPVPLRGM